MESRKPRPASTAFDLPPGGAETVPEEAADVPQSILTESADPGAGAAVETPAPITSPKFASPNEDKAAQLGLKARENASALAAARYANLRRTSHFAKLMALTFLANLLVLGAVCLWLQRRWTADVATASGGPTGSALQQSEELRKADAARFASEMDALRQRLAGNEELNQRQAARVEELSASLSAEKIASQKKTATPAAPAAPPPGSELASAQADLVLLKERNRLTAYADEAIAAGARASYEKLWEALDDPRLPLLSHAARAEILRVQNFYLGGSRIERFDIPVGTYFPEDSALTDSQLKDAQLIKLLRDKKYPWEVRMKAANLLGARRSHDVGDALLAGVKEDDNLDVVKEAGFSFEQMTGFHSRIFDVAPMEQWWKQYKATPTPFKPKSNAATKAKTEEPAAKARPEEPAAKGGTPPNLKLQTKGGEKKKS